jgi:hypothetical protein
MKLFGYELTTLIVLFILFSVILLNISWSCVLSPAIETMKVVNKKKLNKINI